MTEEQHFIDEELNAKTCSRCLNRVFNDEGVAICITYNEPCGVARMKCRKAN